jgi:hypothetical protein
MPVLRSAARRAREALRNPTAAAAAGVAEVAAAPAPPPAETSRRATRAAAREGEREEIRPAEVELGMDDPDSGARSADRVAADDEGNGTPVPEMVSCSTVCSLCLCAWTGANVQLCDDWHLRGEIWVQSYEA